MPYDPCVADERRDSRNMDDDEYRRMREAEDDEYEYHGDAANDEAGKETVIHVDDGYPDPIEQTEDEKKPDIVFNSLFNAAMRTVKADPKLCQANYLDPHKKAGQKKEFYSIEAVDVLIAEYERLEAQL